MGTETERATADTKRLEGELLSNRRVFKIRGDDVRYSVRYPTLDEKAESDLRESWAFDRFSRRRGPNGERVLTSYEIEEEMRERGQELLGPKRDELAHKREGMLRELDGLMKKDPVKEDTTKIDAMKAEITKLETDMRGLFGRAQQLLQKSVEYMAGQEGKLYLVSACTNKEVDGAWVPVWESYEVMRTSDLALIERCRLELDIMLMGVETSFFVDSVDSLSGEVEEGLPEAEDSSQGVAPNGVPDKSSSPPGSTSTPNSTSPQPTLETPPPTS